MVTAYTKESLKDLSGEELLDGEKKPITNGKILINALMTPLPGDEQLEAEEKLKRFLLAKKLFKEEICDLSAEEVVLLRKLVTKNYGVIVVGQILEWLQ